MSAIAIDWREIFVGQVRSIQSAYPIAHAALLNWGRWSRDVSHIFPGLAKMHLWDMAPQSQWGDWGDEGLMVSVLPPAKSEKREELPVDERSALEIDARLHRYHDYPPIWRRVLAAAYVSAEAPEYQFPRIAKVGQDGFLVFLDSAMAHLERAME